MATHQSLFAATADIQRRRWRRHQWLYDYRRRDASVLESFRKIGGNLAFDITCKYGYGPWQFLLVSGVVFLLVAGITKGFWASMGIMKGAVPLEMVTYTDALYYAMLLITTLGFSELLPTTTIGKLVAVSYALFGISWMGLFTAILIRRVIR